MSFFIKVIQVFVLAYVVYSYTDACMQNTTTHNKDERHSLLEKYTSHFIWKGCVWEEVGDQTELQHIDPHSIGHNRVSFPFSWAAQPGAWGPSLFECCFSLPHLISNSSDLQLLSQGPVGSLCWLLAFSTTSCLQLVWSPNSQSGIPRPLLPGAGFLYHILSPTGLVSKLHWVI